LALKKVGDFNNHLWNSQVGSVLEKWERNEAIADAALNGYRTLAELSAEHGVSRERIRQVLQATCKKRGVSLPKRFWGICRRERGGLQGSMFDHVSAFGMIRDKWSEMKRAREAARRRAVRLPPGFLRDAQINELMTRHRGRVTRVAHDAGLSRQSVYKWIKDQSHERTT
jgi:hypothetical protein